MMTSITSAVTQCAPVSNLVRAAFLVLALASCERGSPAPPASPSATGLVATTSSSADAAPPDPAVDASWAVASDSLDEGDLAALGQRVGARALADALADPAKEAVARKALPFAPDVDEAFVVIAERISASTAASDTLQADLGLLLRLTEKPQRFGERLDPEADARVLEVLERAASDAAEPARRAEAQTLITRLRERGLAR